jgi:deoxyhypusine monooxygenase
MSPLSLLSRVDGKLEEDATLMTRHEVAYIFGQLCSPHSVPSLLHVLRDQKEDDMVRHEAAEALGGIASDAPSGEGEEKEEDVLKILREWAVKADAPVVVRESCQVAIDMWEVSRSSYYSSCYLFPFYILLLFQSCWSQLVRDRWHDELP